MCSGTAGSEGCRDLLDGLGLGGAHALTFLLVRRRDLAREGEDEAPVIPDFPGRRLALEHGHRVAPSSTTFHSSGEKAAFDVIGCSFLSMREAGTAEIRSAALT